MRILSESAAAYFCGTYSTPPAPTESVDEIVGRLRRPATIKEGSPVFVAYRDNLLRETERSYYVALSCFRRAHDALIASSAFWGHVGLYYANWFAAHAILGAFGGWASNRMIVEAIHDTPGSQEFRSATNPDKSRGSHKAFWGVFYSSVTPLRLSVDPRYVIALDPVRSNPDWQIDTRNRLNYTMSEIQKLSSSFLSTFDPTQFPLSLPGDTATQYQVTRASLLFAGHLITSFGVATDTFAARASALQAEIIDVPIPALFTATDSAALVI